MSYRKQLEEKLEALELSMFPLIDAEIEKGNSLSESLYVKIQQLVYLANRLMSQRDWRTRLSRLTDEETELKIEEMSKHALEIISDESLNSGIQTLQREFYLNRRKNDREHVNQLLNIN